LTSLSVLIGFALLTAAAAYIQTVTGFAFGLITMGGVGLTGLLSLADAAVIVSVLSLVNATQMLTKGWRDVAWRQFALVMVAGAPMLFVGFWLLEQLAGSRVDLLRITLGVVIIVSSVQLARKPQAHRQPSSGKSFLFFGAVAGVMGGMFSTSGPPLVYHMYRQPLSSVTIRETLVAVFAMNAAIRIGLATVSSEVPASLRILALAALPSVMGATYAARRWPPPFSPDTLRRVVFLLLLLSGVSLGAPAILHLFAATPG